MTRAGVVLVFGGVGVLLWRVLVLAGLPSTVNLGRGEARRIPIHPGWSISTNQPAMRMVDQSLGTSIAMVAVALVVGTIVGFGAAWLRSAVAGGRQADGGAGRANGAIGWLVGALWTPPVPLAVGTVVLAVARPHGSGGQATVLVVALGGVVALLVGAASEKRWCRRAWLAGLAAGLAAVGRSLTVLTGALVVGEALVNRHGVGMLLVNALMNQDRYVIADAVTVLLVVALIGQVVAALAGAWLDYLEPAAPASQAPSSAGPASFPGPASAVSRRSAPGTALGIAALASLVLPVLLLAASFVAGDANRMDLAHAAAGPSSAHPLGTDAQGRDLLARLLVGYQHAILLAVGAALLAGVVGVAWGALAVLLARRLRGAGGPLAEVLLAPARLIAVAPLLIAGVILVGADRWPVIIALAVALAARLSAAIAELDRPAPVSLPRLASAAGGAALVAVGIGLSVLVGLGYLGLDAPPPTPTLGGVLAAGLQILMVRSHVAVLTAVVTLAASVPWLVAGVTLARNPRRAEAIGTLEA